MDRTKILLKWIIHITRAVFFLGLLLNTFSLITYIVQLFEDFNQNEHLYKTIYTILIIAQNLILIKALSHSLKIGRFWNIDRKISVSSVRSVARCLMILIFVQVVSIILRFVTNIVYQRPSDNYLTGDHWSAPVVGHVEHNIKIISLISDFMDPSPTGLGALILALCMLIVADHLDGALAR